MDQGRQGGREADAVELPPVPGERGAAVVECDRLQSGEPLAAARAAEAHRHLVADEPAATPRENGGPLGQTRSVLLGAPGGRAPDAAAIRAIVQRLETLSVPAGERKRSLLRTWAATGPGRGGVYEIGRPTQPCLA